MTKEEIEKEEIDGKKIEWFRLNGEDTGTGYVFDNEVFGIFADGSLVDSDCCPLECESDYRTIAVKNSI